MQEIRVSIDGETHFVQMFGASDKPHFGWEYCDVGIFSQQDRDLYVGIINSEKAMVRFFGSTGLVIDFTISKNQKEALKEVLLYCYIRKYQAKEITMEEYLEWVAQIKQ